MIAQSGAYLTSLEKYSLRGVYFNLLSKAVTQLLFFCRYINFLTISFLLANNSSRSRKAVFDKFKINLLHIYISKIFSLCESEISTMTISSRNEKFLNRRAHIFPPFSERNSISTIRMWQTNCKHNMERRKRRINKI